MVKVEINDDFYTEIKNLNAEIKTLSKKFDHLTSLLENSDTKELSTTDKEPENSDRESLIADLSQMHFDSESEATDILKFYGFEKRHYGSVTWYINNTLHLTCRIEYDGGRYWKIAFSSPVSSHSTSDVDALSYMKFYGRSEGVDMLKSYGFEETAFGVFTNSRTGIQCRLSSTYDPNYENWDHFYWKVLF